MRKFDTSFSQQAAGDMPTAVFLHKIRADSHSGRFSYLGRQASYLRARRLKDNTRRFSRRFYIHERRHVNADHHEKLSELTPYANNPRKNDAAVDYVANSIKAFGFKVPIVIDAAGEIVAGHTRLKAAKKLKLKEVPCIVADDLTPEQLTLPTAKAGGFTPALIKYGDRAACEKALEELEAKQNIKPLE